MLVSARKGSDTLGLVKLALSLISAEDKNIPSSLVDHFNVVIAQAKDLAIQPTSVPDQVLPESIELAIEIKNIKDLSNDLNGITNLENITPDLANSLLRQMEKHAVY